MDSDLSFGGSSLGCWYCSRVKRQGSDLVDIGEMDELECFEEGPSMIVVASRTGIMYFNWQNEVRLVARLFPPIKRTSISQLGRSRLWRSSMKSETKWEIPSKRNLCLVSQAYRLILPAFSCLFLSSYK